MFYVWSAPSTGGFIEIPFEFVDNFILGLSDFKTVDGRCIIKYFWDFVNSTINGNITHGVQLVPSVVGTSQCGFNLMRSAVFYIKTWQCDPPYYYFNLSSNMCQDRCGDYHY